MFHFSILPVGFFGEDAAESRNKYYKQDRLHHSRKSSRMATMRDMFERGLDTSDPILSSTRQMQTKSIRTKKGLPHEVDRMLRVPNENPGPATPKQLEYEDPDADQDYICDLDFCLSPEDI